MMRLELSNCMCVCVCVRERAIMVEKYCIYSYYHYYDYYYYYYYYNDYCLYSSTFPFTLTTLFSYKKNKLIFALLQNHLQLLSKF